jgi:hypothetical protein
MVRKFGSVLAFGAALSLGSLTGAYADCDDDDRPGTPTDLVASAVGTNVTLTFRNTAREGGRYWDIDVRDGAGNDRAIGRGGVSHGTDFNTGYAASAAYGDKVVLYFSHQDIKPNSTVCFRVRARTGAGSQGCVSKIWGNTSCVTIPDPSIAAFCTQYASDAFNQVATLRSRKLGGACAAIGGRWNEQQQPHYDWCVSVRGQPQSASWPDMERNIRNDVLAKCKPTTASGSVAAPPPPKPATPPPPPRVCAVNALVTVDQCYNVDGTPSQYYSPGSTQVSGCGTSEEEAVNAAKASLGISLADDPEPNSCTFTKQTWGGVCSCSPLRGARSAKRASFRLPKVGCAGDMRPNAAGRCACPAGTSQSGTGCVADGGGGAKQTSAPGGGGGVQQGEEPGGGTHTQQAAAGAPDPHAGLCPPGSWGTPPFCKKGTGGINKVYPGECPPGSSGEPPFCQPVAAGSTPTAVPPTCFGNMVAGANGQCACPPGTTWNGRQCLAPVGGGGLNKAVQPLQCPPGTVGVFPDCRGTGGFDKIQPGQQKPCPPGTIGVFPNCRPLGPGTGGFDKIQPQQQPPHCSGGKCICPPGYVDVGATCVRPAQQANCPTGTSGIFPKCIPTGSGGINKSQPGGGINKSQLGGGINKSQPGGGINKSQPGGGINKSQPGGGINKSQPGGGINKSQPGGGINKSQPGGGINKSQSGKTKAALPPVAKPRPAKPRPKPKPKPKPKQK